MGHAALLPNTSAPARPSLSARAASHRELSRRAMKLAWGLFRPAPSAFDGMFTPTPSRSFAACLKAAWAMVRRMDAFNRARPLRPGRDGVIRLASPIYSPASNRLAGVRHGFSRDRETGRSIARAGW